MFKNFKSHPFRIYVADTDSAGVVHHSNYLKYFEAGRIEFLRHMNHPYNEFQNQGIGFAPVSISINYTQPLRADDAFVVSTQLISLKRASFEVVQSILRQTDAANDDTTMVDATIRLACVKEPDFKPMGIPKTLHQEFSKLL